MTDTVKLTISVPAEIAIAYPKLSEGSFRFKPESVHASLWGDLLAFAIKERVNNATGDKEKFPATDETAIKQACADVLKAIYDGSARFGGGGGGAKISQYERFCREEFAAMLVAKGSKQADAVKAASTWKASIAARIAEKAATIGMSNEQREADVAKLIGMVEGRAKAREKALAGLDIGDLL